MKTLNYRIILIPEEEGGYTAKVPAIRGCITYGETVEEAIAMAKDAIEGCLEVLIEEGQPLPQDDSNTLEYQLTLTTELV
ncbi:MAG: type II toxin-antitoxin system HicB family antitoxin [Spirosomataceae bacterium]